MMADREARFDELTEAYHAAFVRMAQVYEYNPELRRDLVQEVLCAIWSALPRFGRDSSLKTYAFRIAHNVCVTHVAKAVKRHELLMSIDDLPTLTADGVAAAEQRDTRQRLIGLIQRLKPRERAIALMYLEGFDHAEIADVLGISEGNAATLLHRTKLALTDALKGGTP